MIPEFLYTLSERDQQSVLLEPVARMNLFTAPAIQLVNEFYEVPAGNILVLQSAVAIATPGAAQNVTGVHLKTRPVASAAVSFIFAQLDLAAGSPANQERTLTWTGPALWIPPSSYVIAQAQFNAGGAANNIRGVLTGYLIPRGQVRGY